MATPAASAWHRRRILTEISSRLTTATPSSNTTARQQHHEQQLHQPQYQQQNSTQQRSGGQHQHQPVYSSFPNDVTYQHSSAPPLSPSIHRRYQPSNPSNSSALSPLHRLLHTAIDPFVNFAQSSAIRVFLAVLVTIVLLHVMRMVLMKSIGTLFLNCSAVPPSLSSFSRFISISLIPLLVTVQLGSHFLLTKALDASPPANRAFFFISLFTTPIHALLSAYILYGPSLAPHQFFCSVPTSLLPSRNALHTPVLTAVVYVPFLYMTVFYLGIYSVPPSPFSKSTFRRLLSSIPQAIITTSIPAIPTILIAVIIAILTRPPRSFYASMVLTGSRTAAAVCATVAAVLPHALLRFSQGVRADNCSTSNWGVDDEETARETLKTAPSAAAVRGALVTLCRAPRVRMLPFPPFGDPSGRQWRITLDAALAPLVMVTSYIRDARRPSNATIDANAFVASTALAISNSALQEAIAVARILPTAFEMSVHHDQFGVTLPTLPYALALLVLLHDGLTSTVSSHCGANPTSWLFTGDRSSGPGDVFKKIINHVNKMVEQRSQMAALRALKDVIVVCVYRLCYDFQEEVSRFVEGHEPGWDVEATEALRPFLRFEV